MARDYGWIANTDTLGSAQFLCIVIAVNVSLSIKSYKEKVMNF